MSSSSTYMFYDASCFSCPSLCGLASPEPSGAVCDYPAMSSGGGFIISYTNGTYVQSAEACGAVWYAPFSQIPPGRFLGYLAKNKTRN